MDDRACTRAGGGGGGVGAGGESISVRFQLRCYLPLLSVKLLCDANEPAGRGGAAGRRGRAPASCTHSNIAQIFLAAAVPTQPASFSECIRVRFSTADINPIKNKVDHILLKLKQESKLNIIDWLSLRIYHEL